MLRASKIALLLFFSWSRVDRKLQQRELPFENGLRKSGITALLRIWSWGSKSRSKVHSGGVFSCTKCTSVIRKTCTILFERSITFPSWEKLLEVHGEIFHGKWMLLCSENLIAYMEHKKVQITSLLFFHACKSPQFASLCSFPKGVSSK